MMMNAAIATSCGPVLNYTSVVAPYEARYPGNMLPHDVVIEVEASSVNPVDWKILECGGGARFPTVSVSTLVLFASRSTIC
jgi:NADPH:quinone reductase-like Zn-dependent oxidoreductase